MSEQINPQTLQELLQLAQQQVNGGAAASQASPAPTALAGASPFPTAALQASPTPTALAIASTAANIWAGYQADKQAKQAKKLADDRYNYNRKKTEEETARATRRALKNETAGDAATAMNTLDWFGSKYQAGA